MARPLRSTPFDGLKKAKRQGGRYSVNRRRRVARQPLEGWPEKFATMDGNYAQSGAAAQKAMLDDKDEADVTKALKR